MYVAISKDLIERVADRISRMNTAEVQSTLPNLEKSYAVDASGIYNKAAFGEHLHLLDISPNKWFRKRESANIHVSYKSDETSTEYDRNTSITFAGMTNAWTPPNGSESSYYVYSGGVTISIDEVLALPVGTPGRQEIIDRVNDARVCFDINARWDKVRTDVVSFLKKCKSLNEAIKLLPSIKLYVDKIDIERLERKVERAPRPEIVMDIDSDTITASAVAARMSGVI
jgi:hypothetical protein